MLMYVYVVMGGWEYEGHDNDTMCIFTDKLDAEVYKLELQKKALTPITPFYDFVHIIKKRLYTEKTIN